MNTSDFARLCTGELQGFKMVLHNPVELPKLTNSFYRYSLSQEANFAVKPIMITISEDLRPSHGYSPKLRQCYFSDERCLKYFKVYTQDNCEIECLTNFTYERCGCVQFAMPHGPDMEICNSQDVRCAKKAHYEIFQFEIERGLKISNSKDMNSRILKGKECKCLPACTSLTYEAETSQINTDWNAYFKTINMTGVFDDLNFTKVRIFFKDSKFITSRRSELYGPTDFLANCGGLLGLFLGFSVLSIVEIIYFLTLRLFCRLRTNTRNKNLNDKLFE